MDLLVAAGGDAVGCFLLGCLGGVRGRTGSVRVTRASDSLGRSKKEARYFTQVGEGDGPAGKTGHARAIFPCLAHEGLPLGSCVLLVGFMGYSDRGFADEKQPV